MNDNQQGWKKNSVGKETTNVLGRNVCSHVKIKLCTYLILYKKWIQNQSMLLL